MREYVTWRVQQRQIDWRVWRDGEYELLEPDSEGVYRSEILPGLLLDGQALIDGNMTPVAEVQRATIGAPEHAAFVARLNGASSTNE